MKRLMLLCGFAALFAAPYALASTVQTFTGTASWAKPFAVTFQNASPGDLTVNASWAPTAGVDYVFKAGRVLADGTKSEDCILGSSGDQAGGQPLGNWTCSFPAAAAGSYWAKFTPIKGKPVVTITVTSG